MKTKIPNANFCYKKQKFNNELKLNRNFDIELKNII